MVTPDKDYTQLVSENAINIYKPSSLGKGYDVIGVDEVKARFGIQSPKQVIDILALWGDASGPYSRCTGNWREDIQRIGCPVWNSRRDLQSPGRA